MEIKQYEGRGAPAPPRSRIVVVSHVVYQSLGDQPVKLERSYSRQLTTTEQPYLRKLTIGSQWVPLDKGWLNQASLLDISNEEGKHLQVNPEDWEALAIKGRVVEVACIPMFAESAVKHRDMHSPDILVPELVADWLVPPRESIRVIPTDLSRVRLRCQNGEARCVLSIFPI